MCTLSAIVGAFHGKGTFRDQSLRPSFSDLVESVMEMVGVSHNEMIMSPR